jgi:hypothetical protein
MLLTLHDFLTGLLRGVGLLGLALAAGGVMWALVVLRVPRDADRAPRAARRCLKSWGSERSRWRSGGAPGSS